MNKLFNVFLSILLYIMLLCKHDLSISAIYADDINQCLVILPH